MNQSIELMIAGGAASLFLIIGVIMFLQNLWFVKRGIRTVAKVVGGEVKFTAKRGRRYYPVLEFEDRDGNVVQAKADVATKISYIKGTKLEIYYNPGNKEQIKLSSIVSLYVVPVIFVFIASLFLYLVLREMGVV